MSSKRASGRIAGRRLAGVAFAAVVMISALAVAPATTAAQSNGTNTTFVVEQGSQCTQITPLGNGTKTVAEFYDYEVLNDTANYSSLGTVALQQNQTSQVFVYRGSDGLSLVFLHGKINTPAGFVATGDLSGLPSDGEWVVEDDNYTNRDDSFNYTDTGAHIQWYSNGERTDGAAFRGVGSSNYTTITADIKFNEHAEQYPFDEWTGSPADNRIERWIVRSGNGDTAELDMDKPIRLSPGTCEGGVSTFTPSANGSNASATSGTSVSTPSNATAGTTTGTTTTHGAMRTTNGSTTPKTTGGSQATTQATTASEPGGNENATAAGNGSDTTGSSANESGDNGSGAFGPGFGVGVGLVAVLLAVGALARRRR